MGTRPDDVPSDYVITQLDRDHSNYARWNLRYVPPSFASWNQDIRKNRSSKFKGVYWEKTKSKWRTFFGPTRFCKRFSDERAAAKAVAKEVVSLWPWAAVNTLLVGPGLLTKDEILQLQQEIIDENGQRLPEKVKETLPRGVFKSKTTFAARFRGQYLGSFQTSAEAGTAVLTRKGEVERAELKLHNDKVITRDANGMAVIALTGNKAEGRVTQVPEALWHQLTFNASWNFDGTYAKGRWNGQQKKLHILVYSLLYPDWDGKSPICHVDVAETLNNTQENLKMTDPSYKFYRTSKRADYSSQYVNVHRVENFWRALITIKGKRIHIGNFSNEHDAVREVNIKARELLGDNARIQAVVQ